MVLHAWNSVSIQRTVNCGVNNFNGAQGNAADTGGAVAISVAVSLRCANCSFTRNRAVHAGGAIIALQSSRVDIAGGSDLSNNVAGTVRRRPGTTVQPAFVPVALHPCWVYCTASCPSEPPPHRLHCAAAALLFGAACQLCHRPYF